MQARLKVRHTYFKHLQKVLREEAEVTKFVRRWENSALWFLLSLFDRRSSRSLVTLDQMELEDTMLDALEAAVRDEPFQLDLQNAVEQCTLLTAAQRHHLVHGLDHAHHGEWLDACPPLLNGLEGAFWSVAREQQVINEGRFLVKQPTKLIKGVESLFRHLPAADDYITFLRRRVFGQAGNPYRHGDAEQGQRRQALFCVAALAGWLEEFADTPIR